MNGGLAMSKVINQDLSIGESLRALRQNVQLSQEEAAARLQIMGISISREIISQMELGKHNIRVSVLIAMKEVYEVSSFDEFFDGVTL